MSRAAAALFESAASTFPPNRTSRVDTTLSFAMNPLMNDVTILQSPSPRGLKMGANIPATMASMLSSES